VNFSFNPEATHCAACGSRDIRRSRVRGIMDGLMGKFNRQPWRCRQCGKRFYRSAAAESGTRRAAGERREQNG
jgi:hypothetical protein